MGMWTLLVGARTDLPLRYKWWHRLAQVMAVVTVLAAGLAAAGRVKDVSAHLTADNTNSLSLLSYVMAHPGVTALEHFRALPGTIGRLDTNGSVVPIPLSSNDGFRCEAPPGYASGSVISYGGVEYRTIPDRKGETDGPSHCAATAAFQSLTADGIGMFEPTERAYRQQGVRRTTTGIIAALIWLVLYWNVYYRSLVPIYARRREKRRGAAPDALAEPIRAKRGTS